MNHALRFTAAKIAQRLDLVRPFIFRRQNDLVPFRIRELANAAEDPPLDADPAKWPEIAPETYWGRADLNFWMETQFAVPEGWNSDRVALHLPLGAFGDIFNHPEALVVVDGVPIGSADRYHHTVAIDSQLADGMSHRLALHGWTGHTQWPPDSSSRAKLFMGRPAVVERDPVLLEFVTLAETALDSCSELEEGNLIRDRLLDALDAAFLALDTRDPLDEALYKSAATALSTLRDGIAQAGSPLDAKLHAIGHAHMDVAYLWPIDQIRRKNARTYSNVLRLMDADPNFHFSHSQPQLYAYCERDHPSIFRKVSDRVAEGRWEVMGGMWVEPDLNIAGPEALVRQLLLGRKYFRERFGDVETPVLWLPDTFGFPGQIPQLMAQSGLKWFCTNKLNWNQVTRVPHTHLWEGIDGTRVLAHILTTPRDVQYLPFPTNYKSDLTAREVLGTVTSADPDAENLPICFGYGDGGGGPSEELMARVCAYASMPGMPQMHFSTVKQLFEAIEAEVRDLPVHQGEHYMEGHRGVLTSQAWIKRANRRNERALHEAEALSVMAGIVPDLAEAWRLLCLNQFHDIVTGTSVRQVFEDAEVDHTVISNLAEAASLKAAQCLASGSLEPVILNTAPVITDRVIELSNDLGEFDAGQPTDTGSIVFAPSLAPYSCVPISQAISNPPEGLSIELNAGGARLENNFVSVAIDDRGRISNLIDKSTGTECLSEGEFGNQFQAFEDRPICWDAWDIDPFYQDRVDLIEEPANLSIVEAGPVRAVLRVEFKWQNSTIRQDMRLSAHSPRIDFSTEIEWNQTHTLLKVAFPVDIRASQALFDIQWGTIERPTTRNTPRDYAMFEVAAHKWALLSDESRGFALLNDCKYGHDVTGHVLRLTLIKSSTAPDPNADQGCHQFTYSVLPMAGVNRPAIDSNAYDLNTPVRVQVPGDAEPRSSRFDMKFRGKRVIPESLVPVDEQNFQVRVFEPDGTAGIVDLQLGENPVEANLCNLMGERLEKLAVTENTVSFEIAPFEIKSLNLSTEN